MTIRFSGTMLRYIDYRREIELQAATIGDAIAAVVDAYPDAKPVLLDGNGHLRSFHQVFVNSEQVANADMDRPLEKDDQLDIVTAVAGG